MFVMAIPLALARRRDYSGPAMFSYGFRPFFFAAAWAALGIVLWLPQFFGEIALPIAMGSLDWHVHEMLYGYVAAVIAGFLLTAVPNWTGRLPICGLPLAMLAALWLAGRIAILVSAKVSLAVAAAIDVAFLATMAAVVLRRDRRRAELAQSARARDPAGAGRRKRAVARRDAVFRCWPLWAADRACGDDHIDHDGRRSHRAELHPQLDRALQSGPPAGAVRTL
jgi:hypothetical protein